MSSLPFHVAVVGAGASGNLVAANFKRFAPNGRLALIGNSSKPGKGVAYETMYCVNLLNVPAGNMSAFPDDMNHFVAWLKTRFPDSHAGTFASRITYGDYLADIFSSTVKENSNIEYVEGDVISVVASMNIGNYNSRMAAPFLLMLSCWHLEICSHPTTQLTFVTWKSFIGRIPGLKM